MSTKPEPRQYHRPIPTGYLLTRPSYVRFLLRELSSVVLACYGVFLIFLMIRARDEAAFAETVAMLKSPLSIVLHLVVLAAAIYHMVTFFAITPSVLVLHRGENRVPDATVKGAHYVLMGAVTLALILIAMAAR